MLLKVELPGDSADFYAIIIAIIFFIFAIVMVALGNSYTKRWPRYTGIALVIFVACGIGMHNLGYGVLAVFAATLGVATYVAFERWGNSKI